MQIPDDTLVPSLDKITVTVEATSTNSLGIPCKLTFTLFRQEMKGFTLGTIGDTVQVNTYSALKAVVASACKLA